MNIIKKKNILKHFKGISPRQLFIIAFFVITVLGASFFSVYSQSGGSSSGSSLSKGLIAHWTLDADDYNSTTFRVSDNTPYENHGTNSGATPTTDRHGKVGGAMSFNGTSNYVLINDVVTTNPSSFTIAAWIKKDGNGSTYECALHQSTDSSIGASSFWLGLDSADNFVATIGARTGVGGGWAAGALTEKPVVGEWNHLLATWDGSIVRVYLNGQFKKQYNLASYSNITNPVRLGASNNGTTYQFNGSIDDVRIYNRSFSDDEVALLYDSYEPKTQISSINSGLVGHWTLSEEDYNSSTNKLSDKTPYENLGTNYSATFTTDRHGKSGGAMSFDGSTGKYIRINRSLNPSSWTVSSWLMKRAHTVSSYPIFWSFGLPYMASNGSEQPFRLSYSAPGQVNTSGTTIPELNQWYHVVATADSSGTKIYVNGNLEGSNSLIATNVGGAFDIGRHLGNDSYRINGAVDDLRIYNRALSAEEISLLYGSYTPQTGGDTLQKGLVLDMPLTSGYTKTETSGSQIMTDKTPYGNDGQNAGAVIDGEKATFNGSDSGITVTNFPQIFNDSVTLSTWAYFNDDTRGIIFGNYSTTIVVNLEKNTSRRLRFYWNNGERDVHSSVNAFELNKWNHLVLMRNKELNRFEFWVNGVLINTVTGTGTDLPNITSNTFRVGRDTRTGTTVTNGSYANLKVYNRSLSEEEIKSLYAQGSVNFGGIPSN